jgi:hypothetical protein
MYFQMNPSCRQIGTKGNENHFVIPRLDRGIQKKAGLDSLVKPENDIFGAKGMKNG